MRIVIIIVVFIFIGCSSRPVPKNIIAPNEMKVLMIDIIKMDEYVNTILIRDSTLDLVKKRSELYEQVFVLHKTNHEAFYKSYDYYLQHPDMNKILFDSLINYGNWLKNKLEIEAMDTLRKK